MRGHIPCGCLTLLGVAIIGLAAKAVLGQQSAACYSILSEDTYPLCAQLNDQFSLHWRVADSYITFGLQLGLKVKWAGIGLSDGSAMKGADMWIAQKEESASAGAKWTLTDYWSNNFTMPVKDEQQDVTWANGQPVANALYTIIEFTRKLDTCDPNGDNDTAILYDTAQQLVWAYGQTWGYHGRSNRGYINLRLNPANVTTYRASLAASDLVGVSTKSTEVRMQHYDVPTDVTTYACTNFALRQDTKYHVVQYSGVTESPVVQRMILYACSRMPSQPLNSPYTCGAMPAECNTPMLLWAPGTDTYTFPKEAGMPFGKNSTTYVALQIHYNNVNRTRDLVDNSGFRLNYTSSLRPNDMGVLTLGSYDIHIPPKQANFSLPQNVCPSNCTQRLTSNVTIVTQFMHMRQIGSMIATRHLRNDSKGVLTGLDPVGSRRYFDSGYQSNIEVRSGSRTLMPGDTLVTTCTYNSSQRTTNTTFGPSSYDEACFNFLYYYPRSPIEQCYSIGDSGWATCATGEQVMGIDIGNDTSVANAVQNGWLVPSAGPNLTFSAWIPPCKVVPPPLPPHTKTALAAIIVVPVVLLIIAFVLWTQFGKYDDPERQKLLAELTQAVIHEEEEEAARMMRQDNGLGAYGATTGASRASGAAASSSTLNPVAGASASASLWEPKAGASNWEPQGGGSTWAPQPQSSNWEPQAPSSSRW